MSIRQIFSSKTGLAAIVNDEIVGSNSKEESLRSIISGLRDYYTHLRSLELAMHDISREANKSTFRIYKQASGYHGIVNVLYNGQKPARDHSMRDSYNFNAENFTLFFNHGIKTMTAEVREMVAREERDGFVEFFKARRF